MLVLVIVSIGCVAASTSQEDTPYDDTRAVVLSQQQYESEYMWTDAEITVLHYEKYGVTCFVMRATQESAAMDCFKDAEIKGI